MAKKQKEEKNEQILDNTISSRNSEDANKKSMAKYCDRSAYGVTYNRDNKRYELITVKYSLETGDAFVEKVELGPDHPIHVMEEINKRFDLTDIKHKKG